MNFSLLNDKVQCDSDSGSVYFLTRDSCSCKGFSFRRTCSHMKEAIAQNLFEQLEERKSSILTVNVGRTKFFVDARIKALKIFLTKNNVCFTDEQIVKYEPLLNCSVKPEQVLKWFKGD